MGQWEYMSECGRWRWTVLGAGGADYHQWDNMAGELIPASQASPDMRSVPRSSLPQGYHSLSPGYRDGWGCNKDGPPASTFAFNGSDSAAQADILYEASQPSFTHGHTEAGQQSNYTFGSKRTTLYPGRLNSSRKVFSNPMGSPASPKDATVSRFGVNKPVMSVNYTSPSAKDPGDNISQTDEYHGDEFKKTDLMSLTTNQLAFTKACQNMEAALGKQMG